MSMSMSAESNLPSLSPPSKNHTTKCSSNFMITSITTELKLQSGITIPLIAMNITWFARIVITTVFLGRLGELTLAGGALGTTLSNVTGFAVLSGLCAAMEPICGQAFGAKNLKLLHKTLVMAITLLLVASLPISFLWINAEKILFQLGQHKEISKVANKYLIYLLPDLIVYSLLCPLKSYLSTQCVILPILLSSAVGLVVHVPLNIILSKARGLEGVAMAVWMSDLVTVILLCIYVLMTEHGKGGNWRVGGWWEQGVQDWLRLLKLCGPCCLTTCLEWWCYEILMLLAGRLPNAKQEVGVLAIVINFDYLLYSVMISLATCASVRISNELGANQARSAHKSANISIGLAVFVGMVAASIMVSTRGLWGRLYSHDKGLISHVEKMLLIMAVVEVFNYPLTVCGGIVRGTARPKLGMYANITGFYLLALPVAVILTFKLHLGLAGILTGYLVGSITCLILLLVFILRIDWDEGAVKARLLTSPAEKIDSQEDPKNSAQELLNLQCNTKD